MKIQLSDHFTTGKLLRLTHAYLARLRAEAGRIL